jgi:hypothetical protein
VTGFALYRYTHPDGSAKEWAWGEAGDTIAVRWGPAGHLVQQAVYPRTQRDTVVQRAAAKEAKGYFYVGQFVINADGRPLATERDATAKGVTPAGRPAAPLIDLARLETGGEDFWF